MTIDTNIDLGTPMNSFVQEAMKGALAMADAASNAIKQPGPIAPAVQTALNYLFNDPAIGINTGQSKLDFVISKLAL